MTITIAQDAELMTNLVSAVAVPASRRFFAFTDEEKNPAVLSHSSKNTLDVVINVDGKPQLKDLGAIWNLPGDVQACCLMQDTDMQLSIAVATLVEPDKSRFYLIYGVMPADLLTYSSSKVAEGNDLFPTIHDIFMSAFTYKVGTAYFPMMFLALQPWDRVTKEDQLADVDISEDNDPGTVKISLNTSWKLGTNTLNIIAVEFGTCRLGHGVFALYETSNGIKLQFRTFGGRKFNVELSAPSGASCLATYYDAETKATALLVGGDKVTWYKYKEYTTSSGTGTTLSLTVPSGLKDIHTAQDGDQVTVWFTTTSDAAHYYSTATSTIDSGALVQLLDDGQGGRLSSLLYSDDDKSVLVKTLVAVDEAGDIIVLQQASDTGMWTSRSLYVTTDDENVEVDSYTVLIRALSSVTNDEDQYTAGCSLHLTASAYVQIIRNGRAATLSQGGGWFEADATGTVTLIIPTGDMSCHTITVDQFRAPNGTVTTLDAVPVLSPSDKVMSKLASIQSGQDLLNATTQSGKKLISPGTVSQDDADQAASIISQLTSLNRTLSSSGSEADGATTDDTTAATLRRATLQDDSTSNTSTWDVFFWLVRKAEEISSPFLETVGKVVHFVCQLAGKVYRFVVDTVSAVCKALSWVFAKIKVGIKAIIDFVGFLFDWDFIVTYSDSIVAFCNAGLDYGVDLLDEMDDKAQSFIDDLKDKLTGRKQPATLSTDKSTASTAANGSGGDLQHGVAYNWSGYQLHHGGVVENLSSHVSSSSSSSGATADDSLKDVYNDLVSEINTIRTLAQDIGNAFIELFNGQCTSSNFFADITDATITALCDSVKNLVDAFIKSVKFVLQTIKDFGNHVIDIPIPCLSALWKSISKGRDFTLFNCVALVTAIPASIIHKITVTCEKNPPKLKGRLTKDAFKSYIEGNATLDPQLAKEILITATAAGAAVAVLGFEVALIAYTMQSVADLPNGCDISPLLGNIIDCVMLNFTALGLIFSWPPSSKFDIGLRWPIWLLQLSNGVFTAFTRMFGFVTKVPRYETKRLVGVYEVATGFGIYALQMTMARDQEQLSDDDDEKEDGAIVVLDVIEDTVELVGCAGFLAAALADHVDPKITYAGLAVWGVCFVVGQGLGLTKISLWGKKMFQFDKNINRNTILPALFLVTSKFVALFMRDVWRDAATDSTPQSATDVSYFDGSRVRVNSTSMESPT